MDTVDNSAVFWRSYLSDVERRGKLKNNLSLPFRKKRQYPQ
ncbi:MAG: hypothetical protein ACE5GG_01110 [Candidatus Omnitrophota bacterium]